MKLWRYQVNRSGISIVGLVILVILLVGQTYNQAHENQVLEKANASRLEEIERTRAEQIGDLASLLALVQRAAEAAAAKGFDPAVTVERAVEALRESGFSEKIIDEAIKQAKDQPGPPGPPGPQGPPGQQGSAGSPTTTSTAPAAATTTTRPPASTTTTTRPTPTTTTTRPCTLGLLGSCVLR